MAVHLKHATFVAQRAEEDKTKMKWIKTAQDQEEVDRWIKTKKGIDGSRFKKARPKKQSLYQCPGWGRRRSLQVTTWKRKQDPRSNHYTDAQVGDAEGLFKSLWIIILQPQVNLSMRVSL